MITTGKAVNQNCGKQEKVETSLHIVRSFKILWFTYNFNFSELNVHEILI